MSDTDGGINKAIAVTVKDDDFGVFYSTEIAMSENDDKFESFWESFSYITPEPLKMTKKETKKATKKAIKKATKKATIPYSVKFTSWDTARFEDADFSNPNRGDGGMCVTDASSFAFNNPRC
jgi:hypothetical protein